MGEIRIISARKLNKYTSRKLHGLYGRVDVIGDVRYGKAKASIYHLGDVPNQWVADEVVDMSDTEVLTWEKVKEIYLGHHETYPTLVIWWLKCQGWDIGWEDLSGDILRFKSPGGEITGRIPYTGNDHDMWKRVSDRLIACVDGQRETE